MSVILSLMILLPSAVIAQHDQPNLRVQGKASLQVMPDEAVARFAYNIIDMKYESAIQRLGRESDGLKELLGQQGFRKENLKTVFFNVGVNRIYQRGQQQDSGYLATQVLEIRFPYESKALINLMNKLSSAETDPDVTFSFQLSEREEKKVRAELISMAIKDAREKASTITKAADLKVTGILEIRYGEFSGSEQPMYRMMEARAADEPSYGGFNVQELNFTETIDVTYSIE